MVVGNWGIFRFGEFAVAGTTQSSVVSVLRAQHGGGFQFTCIHSPSPRISPEAWKLSWDLESKAFISALFGGVGMSCGAQLN